MSLIKVISRTPGFRRGGRAWPNESIIDGDELMESMTEEQMKQFEQEVESPGGMLSITEPSPEEEEAYEKSHKAAEGKTTKKKTSKKAADK